MKKLTLLSLISALSCSPFVYAGGMGDSNMCCSAFMSLEGGYTWNTLDGYDFTISGTNLSLSSIETRDQYTARLAAGMIAMVDDDFGVTGELGWGYYGKTKFAPEATGFLTQVPAALSLSHTISGFDALLGVAFVQPSYSLSFKAGAMIQNMQNKSTSEFFPFGLTSLESMTVKNNTTAVLPEIKLGASYNFNQNWALTGAYLFALGGRNRTTGDFNVNTFSSNLNVNSQNPTLNSLLLGFQYTV